jgi:hypothetical protein
MIHGQVEPRRADRPEDEGGRQLSAVPPPPRGHQRVKDAGQDQGQGDDWPGRLSITLPWPEYRDPDGAHAPGLQSDGRGRQFGGEEDDQVDGEVREPAERDQGGDRRPGHDLHYPGRAQRVDTPHHVRKRVAAYCRHRVQHGEVSACDGAERGLDRHGCPQRTRQHGQQQIPPGAAVDVPGQQRRFAGWPAPSPQRRGSHAGSDFRPYGMRLGNR